MYRVKIKRLPQARFGRNVKTGQQMDGALAIQPTAMGGADIDQYMGEKPVKTVNTLRAVPRDEANLEAEGGETAYGDLNGDGMAEHAKIVGPRHSNGGVPLNLPDDTFIYSDTRSMMIKDPELLAKFDKSPGKGKKTKGYTPAQLAKQYDVNKYRKILQDPNSDKIDKRTAEIMIRNYNMKLGALALAQESKKGFPQGIPTASRPYMEANGIKDEDILPNYKPQAQQGMQMDQIPEDGMPVEMPSGAPLAMSPEMMQAASMDMAAQQMPQQGMMPQEQMPMGQYGMFTGSYDPYDMYEYGGSTNSQPMYQDGGEITEKDLTEQDKKIIEEKWNNNAKAYIDFINTKKGIESNTEFVDDLYNQYKQDIENKENYTAGARETLYKGYLPALKKVDKQTMVNQLLAQEERNARLAAYGLDPAATEQSVYGKTSRTNKAAMDLIAKTPGLKDLDFSSGFKGQAAYISYRNLLNTEKYKPYGQFQEGVSDEEIAGKVGQVSGIDNANTNTTLGQRLNFKIPKTPAKPGPGPCSCTDNNGNTYDPGKDASGKCLPCEPAKRPDLTQAPIEPTPPTITPAEWTTPDLLNYYGALKDRYSITREFPYGSPVDLPQVKLRKLDPTRELAANAEQIGIQAQGLAQFAGPQQYSSRASQLSGAGAANAANILSRINNENLRLENQEELANADTLSKERMANQAMTKQLYDQTAIMNQQYQNAINQAEANKRAGFATGWKNASDLAMVNAMSEQYEIDPRAGTVWFQGGKGIEPQRSSTFRDTLNEYRSLGYDPKDAIAATKAELGAGSGYTGVALPDNYADQYMQKGGVYVMGSNVFPFMFY
jgi:hypothetical protein